MAPRIAVVTGASSGFGLLTAVHLAESGFRVFATMRDVRAQDALQRRLADRVGSRVGSKVGSKVEVVALDVTDADSVTGAIDHIERVAGRIDVLVNNAGIMVSGFGEDVSEQELRRQFETNFFGTVRVTKAVIPGMRSRCFGRVLNVSSLGGRIASPMFSAYHASKFALEGYSEALRYELRPYNVYVSLIEPGLFPTDMVSRNWLRARGARDPESPNHGASERLTDLLRLGMRFAARSDPARVARAIVHAAETRRPRLRYLVGLDARLSHTMARLAPRWWEQTLCTLAGPPDDAS